MRDYGPLRFVVLGVEADSGDLPVWSAPPWRGRRRQRLHRRPPPTEGRQPGARRGRAAGSRRSSRGTTTGTSGGWLTASLTLTVGTGGAPRSEDEGLTPRSAGAHASFAEYGLVRVDDGPARTVMMFIDASGRVRDRVVRALMRVAGAVLAAAGVVGALAVPLLGLPTAFPVLLGAAAVLWLVGMGTAAACVAPPRRAAGLAALAAGLLGWPMLLVYGLAPLWGVAAAACGVVVAVRSARPRA